MRWRAARAYDSVAAENAALNLAMLAQLDQSSLWPQPRDAGITRIALPGGGTQVPGIEARTRDDMSLALVRLASVAATGPEPMREALVEVGQSCRACHAAWPDLRQARPALGLAQLFRPRRAEPREIFARVIARPGQRRG